MSEVIFYNPSISNDGLCNGIISSGANINYKKFKVNYDDQEVTLHYHDIFKIGYTDDNHVEICCDNKVIYTCQADGDYSETLCHISKISNNGVFLAYHIDQNDFECKCNICSYCNGALVLVSLLNINDEEYGSPDSDSIDEDLNVFLDKSKSQRSDIVKLMKNKWVSPLIIGSPKSIYSLTLLNNYVIVIWIANGNDELNLLITNIHDANKIIKKDSIKLPHNVHSVTGVSTNITKYNENTIQLNIEITSNIEKTVYTKFKIDL